jgi:DNA-binding LytR/AlgR family response regulator
MRAFLQQPYPFGESVPRKLGVCAAVGLFVALFLGLFEPFGMQFTAPVQRWLHPVLFGLVTFVVSSACQLVLPRLLPRVFTEEQWKSWKEIVFLLFIVLWVSAGNYLLAEVLDPQRAGPWRFVRVLYLTALVGVFPVVAIVIMKQLLLYRRYAADAVQVNRGIEAPDVAVPAAAPAQPVILQGEGQNERLALAVHDLLFIGSSDNYVEVFFRSEGAVRTKLLRAPLKKIEQQLAASRAFFRCHRTFVVNFDLVERVSGNAQGLRLHLPGVSDPVPVSRSLTRAVKERLAHLPASPQRVG